ncbi:23S rRNA (guanine745-N1)-methyltransferase [Catenuloplanes nepalensis]|uniref:23S rRNA (Guanine745-N1)-methyltransferase n=1 Tax=Catenuloplanes nepalensis TaxID=587533 RepID=A0ABT9N2B3_9ACTN|nr:23S rRNA methyltransferase [Catenuloplanes nepalensis]MDP9797840.1 23S rRNA (guanine745-N1)-methyltransferase [Catenuloplanes nepalensis]
MNASVLARLRCPVCAAVSLSQDAQALRCPAGHSFDVARQGYVNLTTGRTPHVGDTAEMVAAREDFLGAGHYDFVVDALARAARTAYPGAGLIVDAGAGTGRHLAGVLACLPGAAGLALDVSKPALRRAARRVPAALADTWQGLPLADGAAGLVLNVFAPRNGAEFRRVLRPDGRLLVVTPEPDHLGELVATLGLLRVDPDKPEKIARSLGGHFTEIATETARRPLTLTAAEVAAVIGMGPSAWHAHADAVRGATVTAAVRIGTWQPSDRQIHPGSRQTDRSISSQPTGGSW